MQQQLQLQQMRHPPAPKVRQPHCDETLGMAVQMLRKLIDTLLSCCICVCQWCDEPSYRLPQPEFCPHAFQDAYRTITSESSAPPPSETRKNAIWQRAVRLAHIYQHEFYKRCWDRREYLYSPDGVAVQWYTWWHT